MPDPHYIRSISLKHTGDCHFIGISADGQIYVDEIYGDDDWMARHALRLDGIYAASSDESGAGASELIAIPRVLAKPTPVRQNHQLQFSGARWRGMRDEDRIQETVQPISIQEKMALSGLLNIPPMRLIGVAESVVSAETPLVQAGLSLVCRRVRIAYLLASEQRDEQHLPYNYDSIILYLAHFYNAATGEADLAESLKNFTEVRLNRPMDCMVWQNLLLVADGGSEKQVSAVHIWQFSTDENSENVHP